MISRLARLALSASAAGLMAVAAACGQGEGGQAGDSISQIPGVADTGRLFTLDDLVAAGAKAVKEYDVTGLTAAESAWHLFWRVGGVPVEYEARFYPSHDAAVSEGVAFAEEGSGESAILDRTEAMWSEGIVDRRTIFDFRAAPKPKYGGYVVRSNMVLLCEGRSDEEAMERCTALLEAISVSG